MKVELVWVTPDAEKLIAYIARVSSSNQENPEYEKLLRYLIKNRHWSPFEMVSMCVQIHTSRVITQQITRHRSFSYQEFSQRYAAVVDFETVEPRRQDTKDRQNSTDDLSVEDLAWWDANYKGALEHCQRVYQAALERGFAKESARFILPISAMSRLYMTGTARSWIHYLELRDHPHAQLEHQLVAKEIKKLFLYNFPTIGRALDWVAQQT